MRKGPEGPLVHFFFAGAGLGRLGVLIVSRTCVDGLRAALAGVTNWPVTALRLRVLLIPFSV